MHWLKSRPILSGWLTLLFLAPSWLLLARDLGAAPLRGVAGLILVSMLLATAVCDTVSMKIPNGVTLPALGCAWGLNLVGAAIPALSRLTGADDPASSLAGAVLAFLPFFTLWVFGGCAGGDVKLVAAVGAFLGPWGGLNALIWSLAVAGTAALALLGWGVVVRHVPQAAAIGWKTRLPLGPFVAVGVMVSLWIDGGGFAR